VNKYKLAEEAETPVLEIDNVKVRNEQIAGIQRYPKPVISMVEGSVWGGAFEMVMSTDMIIAANISTFAMTPVNLSVIALNVGLEFDIYGNANSSHIAGTNLMNGIGGSGARYRRASCPSVQTRPTYSPSPCRRSLSLLSNAGCRFSAGPFRQGGGRRGL